MHKGIPRNEIADGWAKQAASEPDDHGVEWLTLGDLLPSRPTSLAHLKRRTSEKNWSESLVVVRAETTQQGVRPPGERQARPDPSQGGEANSLRKYRHRVE